ncbi:hypothetical protein XS16_005397 [Salmonella enterica subsp. enterica serovar Newport]|nr:hypothetical protein [Salmonella enterica subsp. enterica serovar Newport]
MRLPEKLPLYAKWFVVWLVVLPMVLHRVEHSGVFASSWICVMVVGFVFGFCVPLVDRVFFFLCQRRK